MRGEETQVFGALALEPSLTEQALVILPGTHSKWVRTQYASITGFTTLMTGELYAILRKHSILGSDLPVHAPEPPYDEAAFDRGVKTARDSGAAGVLRHLFSARALVMAKRLEICQVPSYLSGLLIGEEWRIAHTAGWLDSDTPLRLVAEATLGLRYLRAATHFSVPEPRLVEQACAHGLWRIARTAGWIPKPAASAQGES
jgi:2-dehydro-3-deoxygalactonokinase